MEVGAFRTFEGKTTNMCESPLVGDFRSLFDTHDLNLFVSLFTGRHAQKSPLSIEFIARKISAHPHDITVIDATTTFVLLLSARMRPHRT